MKKEDNGAVPLSLPLPPIAAATVACPCRPPHNMMRVFSRFSPKKVPLEDTTCGGGGGSGGTVGDGGGRKWDGGRI